MCYLFDVFFKELLGQQEDRDNIVAAVGTVNESKSGGYKHSLEL